MLSPEAPKKWIWKMCLWYTYIYIITTIMIMTYAIVIVILLSCYTMIIVLVVISSAFLPLTLFLHDIWRDMNRLSLDFHRQYPFLRCLVVTGNHFFITFSWSIPYMKDCHHKKCHLRSDHNLILHSPLAGWKWERPNPSHYHYHETSKKLPSMWSNSISFNHPKQEWIH